MSWPLSPWVAFRWFQREAEPTDKPPSETNLEAAMASSIFSETPERCGPHLCSIRGCDKACSAGLGLKLAVCWTVSQSVGTSQQLGLDSAHNRPCNWPRSMFEQSGWFFSLVQGKIGIKTAAGNVANLLFPWSCIQC
jgi:hypothetical protein